MEKISSRRNPYIRHLRALAADGTYRRERGEYLCDGRRTLQEALAAGAEIVSILWKERAEPVPGLEGVRQLEAEEALFDYASALKNSPGPLFTVKIPPEDRETPLQSALILESVQDPGNVGTVLRTAGAFGLGAVVLMGECADVYQPKTVRASMGAVFRQRVLRLERTELQTLLAKNGLPLYGAALSPRAVDLRRMELKRAAVAVGSEGRGLSPALLSLCEKEIIIPMAPESESLNAAVAAALIMWEMVR